MLPVRRPASSSSTRSPVALPNPELAALARADQAERMAYPGPELVDHDRSRRVRVEAILERGGARTSEDYFHAALVFERSTSPEEVARAHELALTAVAMTPAHPKARWLAASTEDRLRMSRGEAQRFGTQFCLEAGSWVLHQVDPTVTDDERASWGVPPLAHAQRRAAGIDARMKRKSWRPRAA